MCFRPADAGPSAQCPGCGKAVGQVMGAFPKACPFCKTSFADYDLTDLAQRQAGAPAVPAAPSAPKAPGA